MRTEATAPDLFRPGIRLWRLIAAAGAIAGVASVLGFFGAGNWCLDLFSHFRVQYFLGLSAVAMLLLVLRKRRWAALFGVLAAANGVAILPLYFGSVPVPASSAQPIRAMLVNVNTKTGNATDVATAIRLINPDIVVLEEVNATWLADLRTVLEGYRHSEGEPREDNFGIGLWSRFPFTHSRVVYIGAAQVPSVIAEIATPQGRCTVIATHPLPPGGRESSAFRNGQLAELPRWVRQASSPVILLGDLNATPWNHHFKRLLESSRLRNSAQGRGVCPTWPTFSPFLLIPIDHCLYSRGIDIVARKTGPRVGSDHFPLFVDFHVLNEAEGRQPGSTGGRGTPAGH